MSTTAWIIGALALLALGHVHRGLRARARNVDVALRQLDALLARRAEAARQLAERAPSASLAAAVGALKGDLPARWAAEHALTAALAERPVDQAPWGQAMAAELADVGARIEAAERTHRQVLSALTRARRALPGRLMAGRDTARLALQ